MLLRVGFRDASLTEALHAKHLAFTGASSGRKARLTPWSHRRTLVLPTPDMADSKPERGGQASLDIEAKP
jgi:hypothetical protein